MRLHLNPCWTGRSELLFSDPSRRIPKNSECKLENFTLSEGICSNWTRQRILRGSSNSAMSLQRLPLHMSVWAKSADLHCRMHQRLNRQSPLSLVHYQRRLHHLKRPLPI